MTSLGGSIGPEANLLEPTPASCRQVTVPFPVITNDELAKIVHINADGDQPGYATHVVRGLYDHLRGGEGIAERLTEIFAEVDQAIKKGARFIVRRPPHSTLTIP